MAAMGRKLIVEVVEAHNLLPKDGTGTSSPYVRVDLDGQRRKTRTVHRELNPAWNETLEFNVAGSVDMAGEPLEVNVFHDVRVGPSRRNNFLGRVRLDSRQFVKRGEEALMYFPLEKKSFFSWIRGEIGLRVYYVDEPIPEAVAEPPAEAGNEPAAADGEEKPAPAEPEAEAVTGTPADISTSDQEVPPPPSQQEAEPHAEKPAESELPPPPLEENATDSPPVPDQPPPAEPVTEAAEPSPLAPPELEKDVPPRWVPPPPPPRHVPRPATPEASKYDLVDKMRYLFVRVVRARSLPGGAKPHVRVAAFGRHVSTREARRGAFLEWDQTFAFARDPSAVDSSSTLEVSVWDLPPDSDAVADAEERHFLGGLCFDVSEVSTRDPPDSPLAPQWYRLEGGGSKKGDLMLATWIGTQADESFNGAWKADAPPSQVSSRAKVYLSPKLWYLRVTVIEAQDTLTAPPPREAGIGVRAAFGFQVLKTRSAVNRNGGPLWNEDLVFTVAEPFDEDQRLVLCLEIRHGKEVIAVGSATMGLSSIERRVDDRKVASRWLDLLPNDEIKKGRKATTRQVQGGRLHVRACLDGGYHVADEPPYAASDFRPSARQLWRPPLGAVELGVIGCKGLLPMRTVEGKGSTDAYAVAKYGPKWARTRTVADCFDPAWNEQYTWPVYDPCTVLTVGVFDESTTTVDGDKDPIVGSRPMGKVRIRISTLENDRIYRGSYPLLLMLPSGAKRMGEIELAVRFARAGSALDLIHVYGQPMLPPMHRVRPIPSSQREPLRLAAARISAGHLSRSDPPLRREVVLWMLDAAEPRGFSMRKVRANWQRIAAAVTWVADLAKWMEDMRTWRNPTATMMSHVVLVLLVWYPELIVPTLALHVAAMGTWRYRKRPRGPSPHPCLKASMAEAALDREELDEEFDSVPSSRGEAAVRARYERARAVGARVQGMLGDVAAQAERVQALVTWRDPRATGMFIAMCVAVAVVMYLVPSRVVAVVAGFYYLRHPMFRDRMPPRALNYFRRLPSMAERIM
ncbi:multiple C2 domain and transmembrane region protein 16-like [Typha latifolia]|uniref:multiple C2 domain and transmembrane region protein 16-like n=1 Tax=Typha latifolia TaxID=4733 RepID=UPI003C2B6555